mmetsp:Transcript_7161/g.11297  ORF Transcript_7161/g.11297 Transcript_7161/m.11297 type:complete len:239 (-) Transcript_7161:349-1065(-)
MEASQLSCYQSWLTPRQNHRLLPFLQTLLQKGLNQMDGAVMWQRACSAWEQKDRCPQAQLHMQEIWKWKEILSLNRNPNHLSARQCRRNSRIPVFQESRQPVNDQLEDVRTLSRVRLRLQSCWLVRRRMKEGQQSMRQNGPDRQELPKWKRSEQRCLRDSRIPQHQQPKEGQQLTSQERLQGPELMKGKRAEQRCLRDLRLPRHRKPRLPVNKKAQGVATLARAQLWPQSPCPLNLRM